VILIPRMPQYVHMYVSVIAKSRIPTINIVPYPECVCVDIPFVACMLCDLLTLLDSVTLIILTAVFHIKCIIT